MLSLDLLVAGLISGLVIGLSALAVTLVFGVARFPNAATGDAMSLGAYAALAVAAGTGSLVAGGVAAVLAGILLNVILYLLVFRRLSDRSPIMSLLASIGAGFMIRSSLGLVYGQDPQAFRVPLARPLVLLDVRVQWLDLKLAGLTLATLAVVLESSRATAAPIQPAPMMATSYVPSDLAADWLVEERRAGDPCSFEPPAMLNLSLHSSSARTRS